MRTFAPYLVCSVVALEALAAGSTRAAAQEIVSPRDVFISTCTARWTRADTNGDGWLDKDEIENANRLLPAAIISPASISARQFIEACVRQLQDQQAQR